MVEVVKKMKSVVIYWSGTGVTEGIANELKEILVAQGNDAECYTVSDFSASLDDYELVLLGCSAQGAEVLEEDEFEPFYEASKGVLAAKKVGLFGSYGWGDGEWMRNWVEDAQGSGIEVATGEGLIVQEDEILSSALEEYITNLTK